MPRAPRVLAPGGAYHLCCRVASGTPGFADDAAAREVVETLRGVGERDGLTVFAWCVMPDHYETVVRCSRVALSRSMRLVQGRIARAHGRQRGVRKLWHGRFGARLLADECDIARAIAYVHVLPATAGLVRDPEEFHWSGHRELLGQTTRPLCDVAGALASFAADVSDRRAAYARAITDARNAPWATKAPGMLPWWFSHRPPRGAPTAARGRGVAAHEMARPLRSLAAAELLALAPPLLGITESELRSADRGRAISERRALLALVGVERLGVRAKELAAELGRHPVSVSRWIGAAGARLERDAAFRREADELARGLDRAAQAASAARSGLIFEAGGSSFVD